MEKVIDIEDRIPTLREKRRKRTNKKFIFLITLFFVTLFLLLYFQSPYSDIKTINVKGSSLVGEEEYIKQSSLQVGQSMWSFKEKEIEDHLKELDWVKNVEVNKKWLTSVEIKIEEWQKVAYISKQNGFYPILENGIIFNEISSNAPIDAPIFLAFDDNEMRERLLKELADLNPTVLSMISQINATPTESDPYAITLFMNDGYEVRAEITSLSEKLNYYPSIVAQIENAGEYEKGIIDIEVGTYYRSFSEEYAFKYSEENSEESSDIDSTNYDNNANTDEQEVLADE
ncbi:cell division protein FtsQ/DivIB [Ureibacillus acetophenoni]|uniref:Cell division protein DivIB n=1 Tax=Ureibacillus acetophenoni TaxID=614649 RepID=A0A285U0V5_9BACL|nr:FtsQ-type POTRA domain-containing protein [Ureibacillus acetophenoni]SOC35347.1 cell division protein FtsQ [Ureibacillus acetophenoni]